MPFDHAPVVGAQFLHLAQRPLGVTAVHPVAEARPQLDLRGNPDAHRNGIEHIAGHGGQFPEPAQLLVATHLVPLEVEHHDRIGARFQRGFQQRHGLLHFIAFADGGTHPLQPVGEFTRHGFERVLHHGAVVIRIAVRGLDRFEQRRQRRRHVGETAEVPTQLTDQQLMAELNVHGAW